MSVKKKLKRVPSLRLVEDAELLGFIAGDGSLSESHGLRVFCRDYERERVKGLLVKVFGELPRESIVSGRVGRACVLHVLSLYRGRIAEWAKSVGFWSGRDKNVPYPIMLGSSGLRAGYLRGLFEADGGVGREKGSITLEVVSCSLFDSACYLLSSLGIRYKARVIAPRHSRAKESYGVCIKRGSESRFIDVVGFLVPRKRKRWERSFSTRYA